MTFTGYGASSPIRRGAGFGLWGGIDNLGVMTVTDCTISNDAASTGGGIYSTRMMTLTGCTISQVAGTFGGGVTNYIGGTAVIMACTITNNTTVNQV